MFCTLCVVFYCSYGSYTVNLLLLGMIGQDDELLALLPILAIRCLNV